MNIGVVLILMIFCHIVDDYYLQGILAKLKQRGTWEGTGKKYRHDYIMALYMHGFSWAFMIMLPLLIAFSWNPPIWFWFLMISNTCLHVVIDDLKCNEFRINLVQDQLLHLGQILITWIMYVLEFYLA